MSNSVANRVSSMRQIDWRQMKFFQQPDLKERIDGSDKKLIDSLLKYQFIDPFKVWFSEGEYWCLDGYYRYLDLIELEKLGAKVSKIYPANLIDCKDKTEAAELVLVYSSNYAKIRQQGMFDYVQKYNIDWEKRGIEVNFSHLNGKLTLNEIRSKQTIVTHD